MNVLSRLASASKATYRAASPRLESGRPLVMSHPPPSTVETPYIRQKRGGRRRTVGQMMNAPPSLTRVPGSPGARTCALGWRNGSGHEAVC
ncbi:hypothetical protein HYPSUDRAFT_411234 [Hypholoma sublateritium FD-334 SS-4]|uniref:Uncharacterized protein n=1 Tax=Hypholoma sublateritium (strain FD-334 SS-4) TaxID=945553 RepID=A0A0D2N796_HYPSF|nr:hypothetical protein HYPSUDRAFT_411234 [Hypholoma sublateritium FD-334 SS-4]